MQFRRMVGSGFVMDFMRHMLVLALAGTLLCAPAHAQIAFRSSAQASAAAAATITLSGVGAAAEANPVGGGACAASEFITPSIPGGSNGDLLVAVVINRDGATLTASGAAWNTLHSDNQANHRTRVYWRLATGADALTVTKTGSCTANGVMVGRVARYSGVDTVQPFEPTVRFGYQTTAAAVNHGGGTINATLANSLSLFAAMVSDNNTVNAPTPATFTTAFSTQTGTGNDAAIALFGKLETTAGSKGPYSATMSATDPSTGVFAIIRPAPSLTIAVPAGTAVGDVMIASVVVRPCSNAGLPCTVTVSGHADWTLVDSRLQPAGGGTGGNGNQLFVYRRVITGTEPSSYSWYFAGTPAHAGAAGGILSFSGVDTTNPIVAQQGALTASGSSHTAPQIDTGSVTNTMLVSTHASNSSTTWAFPAGMTERIDVSSLPPADTLGLSLEINTEARAAAGLTGTRTATYTTPGTPANDTGATHMLALRPAVPVVPTPGAFNAFETSTAAGAITGVIRTKVAGSAFSLDVVSISGGAQQAGFTDAVIVELLGNNTLGVSLDAQNCPTSFTLVQTVAPNPTITGGRSTVSFAAVPNSWRDVRVRVRWPTASPTVTWCSTNNFAIRPSSFANFAITDTDWQTAGTGRALNLLTFAATTPTHKAGRPFSVRATALNAAGVPAVTTNYTGAPSATLTACAGAACTATFGTLTLATTFAAGQLTSDVASYNDVGSFRVELVDSSFASVDAGDSSALEREIRSGTIDAGRFVPDHFAVSFNAPVFGTECGSFTYIGRAFNYTTAPVITVTAQDFANNTTTLYATSGSWWRITNASLTGKSYTAATGTLDTSGLPGTDPVILAAGSGMGTLTFASGSGLFFTRTTPTAPASPYDADISLAINVIDADGVTYASNPARFGTATAGNGIAFSSGKSMRFGRLAIRNANGSQLVPLPVQVEAQYWLGAPTNAFVTNAADSCTVIAASNDAMGNFTGNLSGSPTCETAISGGGVLSAGRRTLQLAAPGSSNNGSVDLTLNLGAVASGTTCTTLGGAPVAATTANLPYLQGNWTGGAYDQNPSARAAFGVYRGAEEVVYIRENF